MCILPILGSSRGARGDGVAPCSLISITGLNLSAETAKSPENELWPELGGVTVRVNDSRLPLYFVSPKRITAQLPCDLSEGTQMLTVSRRDQPDVTASFPVVRNAPRLFSETIGEETYAVASHEDGTSITATKPARPGEVVTLYGTGLGRYLTNPPGGSGVKEGPAFAVADPVELMVGESAVAPLYIGATVRAGLTALRWRLSTETNSTLQVRVRINGVESNAVTIPVTRE